jgi:hypothetical protein
MSRIQLTEEESMSIWLGLMIFCLALGYTTEAATGWMIFGAGIIMITAIFK